jgi:hypothetical protein
MSKSAPYLSCHRDYFSAKAPGPVAGWLRQVTQPPHIAGPLAHRMSESAIRLSSENPEDASLHENDSL